MSLFKCLYDIRMGFAWFDDEVSMKKVVNEEEARSRDETHLMPGRFTTHVI